MILQRHFTLTASREFSKNIYLISLPQAKNIPKCLQHKVQTHNMTYQNLDDLASAYSESSCPGTLLNSNHYYPLINL